MKTTRWFEQYRVPFGPQLITVTARGALSEVFGHLKHTQLTSLQVAFDDGRNVESAVPPAQLAPLNHCWHRFLPSLSQVLKYDPLAATDSGADSMSQLSTDAATCASYGPLPIISDFSQAGNDGGSPRKERRIRDEVPPILLGCVNVS